MFMCVVNLEAVNKLDLTWKQSFLIHQFDTFVNLTIHQYDISSISHFINLTFCWAKRELASWFDFLFSGWRNWKLTKLLMNSKVDVKLSWQNKQAPIVRHPIEKKGTHFPTKKSFMALAHLIYFLLSRFQFGLRS